MTDMSRLIARAVEYGMPAFEMARLAYDFSYDPGNARRVPVNSFAHRRILSDHRHRLVTTPNHDTLYSSAVVDLSLGPVTLQVPAFGPRYHSLAFMDAYTNNFAYVGTRATGGEGGSYVIAGPGRHVEAPAGSQDPARARQSHFHSRAHPGGGRLRLRPSPPAAGPARAFRARRQCGRIWSGP